MVSRYLQIHLPPCPVVSKTPSTILIPIRPHQTPSSELLFSTVVIENTKSPFSAVGKLLLCFIFSISAQIGRPHLSHKFCIHARGLEDRSLMAAIIKQQAINQVNSRVIGSLQPLDLIYKIRISFLCFNSYGLESIWFPHGFNSIFCHLGKEDFKVSHFLNY